VESLDFREVGLGPFRIVLGALRPVKVGGLRPPDPSRNLYAFASGNTRARKLGGSDALLESFSHY